MKEENNKVKQLEKDVKNLEALAMFFIMLLIFGLGLLVGSVGLW